MRGVPWYIHPCTPGGHTIPGYIAQYTPLGTPSMPAVHRLLVHHCPLTLRCRLLEPWAQRGRNPWVESLLASQDLKSVTEVGILMRRVFRSPERKRIKDWIVLGETLMNPLWLGCCAQRPLFLTGHPIVEEWCTDGPLSFTRFTVGGELWALSRGCLRVAHC